MSHEAKYLDVFFQASVPSSALHTWKLTLVSSFKPRIAMTYAKLWTLRRIACGYVRRSQISSTDSETSYYCVVTKLYWVTDKVDTDSSLEVVSRSFGGTSEHSREILSASPSLSWCSLSVNTRLSRLCLITSVLVVDDEVTSYAASFHLLHGCYDAGGHSRKFFQPKSGRRRMLLTSGSLHLISNSTTTWTWRVVFSFLRTSDDGLGWVFHLKGCWQRLTGFLDSQFCFKCRVVQKYRLFGDWDLVSSVDFFFEECWLLTKLTVFKTRVLSNLEYGEISLPSSSSHARLLTTRSSTTSCYRSSGFCLFLFSLSLLFFVTCIGSAAQRLFFSSFSRRVLFIHQVRCLSADRALRHICPSSVSRGFTRDLGGLVVSSSVGLDGCGSKDIQVVCPVLVVREERILLIRWKVTLFRLPQ